MADPTIDKSLWVDLGGSCPGMHSLLGNAHTFTGRILTWCPRKGTAFNISVGEIALSRPQPPSIKSARTKTTAHLEATGDMAPQRW